MSDVQSNLTSYYMYINVDMAKARARVRCIQTLDIVILCQTAPRTCETEFEDISNEIYWIKIYC